MKVYITYFRYDRGEQYSIYNLDTSLQRSVKSWYNEDLPNFLGYGPDDVSQLYLVKCSLPKSDVEIIKNFMNSNEDYDEDFYNLMETVDDIGEEIFCTSGDEVWEVLEFFCKRFRRFIDPSKYSITGSEDEDELREILQEILFDNDDLWDKVLKYYIEYGTDW